MIPYFRYAFVPLGPLHIQVWGLFVSLGILAALFVGYRRVRRLGLDRQAYLDMSAWMIVAALAGARLAHAAFYDPGPFLNDPWELLRLWHGGMSVYGGFFGAAAAALVYTRVRKLPFLVYADAFAFALPLGLAIGRLGCFFIHDHPGVLSASFLAVDYPGGSRLDHGLLLSLVDLAIFALFAVLELTRRQRSRRPYLAVFMLAYGAARFGLDFWRAWDLPGSDARYLGLTPAQYFSLALAAAGLVILLRNRRMDPPKPASVVPPQYET